MGDGGGGHWFVQMEWRPAGWSVCLPLLIFPCTIMSRGSLLAPAHPGGPRKRAVKRMWCGGGGNIVMFYVFCYLVIMSILFLFLPTELCAIHSIATILAVNWRWCCYIFVALPSSLAMFVWRGSLCHYCRQFMARLQYISAGCLWSAINWCLVVR